MVYTIRYINLLQFLMLVMGMNAAHSKYACLWCTIPKDVRWDMSVSNGTYNLRTLDDMKQCVIKKSIDEKKGCINLPLFEIEPQQCVPDELHMLLRISDVLFRSFFGYTIYLDKRNKTHRNIDSGLLQKSVKLVKGFGITFSVWMCENNKSNTAFEFTPLNRNERLKVLQSLPQYFDELLSDELAGPLAKLWGVSKI